MGRIFNGLIVAGTLALALPASAADAYLKLDGIDGASRAGAIELSGISFGSGREIGSMPVGIGPDRGDQHTMRVSKRVDQTSLALWKAAQSAQHFPSAVVFLHKAGAVDESYRLGDVVISGFDTNSHGGAGGPTERFTLNFATMAKGGAAASVWRVR